MAFKKYAKKAYTQAKKKSSEDIQPKVGVYDFKKSLKM